MKRYSSLATMQHLCEQQATIKRFLSSRDCAALDFGKEMTAERSVRGKRSDGKLTYYTSETNRAALHGDWAEE